VSTDSRLRFDNFVIGSGNRLAAAAARAVAEAPGTVYNPLFIYGASGLGKSHLLRAIAHMATELQPSAEIEYLTLEAFVARHHAAVSAGESETFKHRYEGHVDLLLLDDVQLIGGQRESQAELLRLFAAMQDGGRQVVLAANRAPSELEHIDERLIGRFSSGLTVDVSAPDYETRLAILRAKALERELKLDPLLLDELAAADIESVRDLLGSLSHAVAAGLAPSPVATPASSPALPAVAAPASSPMSSSVPTPVSTAAVASHAAPRTNREPTPASVPRVAEFQSFITDIAVAVAQHVAPWKSRLAEAIAYWTGEGYRVAVLERALQMPREPKVEGLLAAFAAAVEHLRELEAQATAIDPALGGDEVFRDPERVHDAERLVERAHAGEMPPAGPSAAFTRAGYEVSASNQAAVHAADAVVSEPGTRYNPLFIHGPTGVGKTHLANAIGNEILRLAGDGAGVSFVSAPTFIDELIAAMQQGTLDRWRARYRSAKALIVDDVQFVAGKERTQEELFQVFNVLHDDGRQVILTSDRAPDDLGSVEERLLSRFQSGLVVEILPPDRALREKIYARQLAPLEPSDEPELVEYLASRPASSVREIAGMVNRLAAAADVAGVPLSLKLARAELDPAAPPATAPSQSPTVATDRFFLDAEKVVWDWPDAGGRLIEELR
jgi:chromosomal replication initiation ATPase DnaA